MLHDELLKLQELTTRNGTLDGGAVDIRGGTPGNQALFAEVLYSAASTSSGAGSVTFKAQESEDGSAWADLASQSVTLSSTAANGTLYIPVVTRKRYVRLSLGAISGTGATVAYTGFLVTGKPV